MIKFKDKDIEVRYKSAFEQCFLNQESNISIEDRGIMLAKYPESGALHDLYKNNVIDDQTGTDILLDQNAIIRIQLPTPKIINSEMKLGEVIDILEKVKKSEEKDGFFFMTGCTWVSIQGVTEKDETILVEELKKNSKIRILKIQNTVEMHITSGICEPTIYKIINGYQFDETQDEIYIRFISSVSKEEIKKYINSYIYENSTCLKPADICVYQGKRFSQNDSKDEAEPLLRQRLLVGKGLEEIIFVFNKATKSNDLDMKIIEYSKVLEYVGCTLEFEEKVNRVSNLLNEVEVLKPTADYIKRIIKNISEIDEIKKDKMLIKYVVEQTNLQDTVLELDFVKQTKNSNVSGVLKNKNIKEEDKKNQIAEKIVDIISDTRNQLVHAKANYEKKGNECCDEEKEIYTAFLKYIADRAIRKYAMIQEDYRLTNE